MKFRTIEKIELILIITVIFLSTVDFIKFTPEKILLLSSFFVFLFIFILPGYLLFSMIDDGKDTVQRIAISFSLSLGLLALPGFLFYLLRLSVRDFFVFVLVVNILFLILFLRRKKDRFENLNLNSLVGDKVKLLFWLIIIFLIVKSVTLKLSYPYSGTDNWFYISCIRENMNASNLSPYEPFFGTNYRLINWSCSSWFLLGAVVASVSRVNLIDLMVLYLPVFLIVICIFSFYTLSKEIFRSENKALFATVLQVFYLLVFRTREIWVRIAEPKFMLFYVVTPIALAFAIRYISFRRPADSLIVVCMLMAMANISVVNFAIAFISIVSLYGINMIFNFTKLHVATLVRNLLFILVVVLPLVIVQNVSLFRNKDINRLVYQPYHEGTLPYPSKRIFTRTVKVSEWKESKLKRILEKRFPDYFILNTIFLTDYPHTTQTPFSLLKVATLLLGVVVLIKMKKKVGYQLIAVNTFVPVILLFNPFSATLLGKIFPPSVLYRILWLVPETLVLSAVLFGLGRLIENSWPKIMPRARNEKYCVLFIAAAIFAVLYSLTIRYHEDIMRKFHFRKTRFYANRNQASLYGYISDHIDPNVVILADSELLYTFPLYLNQNTVAAFRRERTVWYSGDPKEGLARWEDANYFYMIKSLDNKATDILRKYNIGYVVTHRKQSIDQDLWEKQGEFQLIYQNEKYRLYKVLGITQ